MRCERSLRGYSIRRILIRIRYKLSCTRLQNYAISATLLCIRIQISPQFLPAIGTRSARAARWLQLCSPLTRTSAWCSMLPSSDDATHVYVAVRRTSTSCSTFLPIGVGASRCPATDGTSTEPRRQRTYGIGEPTATHVRFTPPPSTTSVLSGRIEKCGGTRRTDRKTTALD